MSSESSMSLIPQGSNVLVQGFSALVEEFDSNTGSYILTVLASGQKAVVPMGFVVEQGPEAADVVEAEAEAEVEEEQ